MPSSAFSLCAFLRDRPGPRPGPPPAPQVASPPPPGPGAGPPPSHLRPLPSHPNQAVAGLGLCGGPVSTVTSLPPQGPPWRPPGSRLLSLTGVSDSLLPGCLAGPAPPLSLSQVLRHHPPGPGCPQGDLGPGSSEVSTHPTARLPGRGLSPRSAPRAKQGGAGGWAGPPELAWPQALQLAPGP